MQPIAQGERKPDVCLHADDFAGEARRGDSSDRDAQAVDENRPPDDRRIALEATHPIVVADDGSRRRVRVVGLVIERASSGGLHAEYGEVLLETRRPRGCSSSVWVVYTSVHAIGSPTAAMASNACALLRTSSQSG